MPRLLILVAAIFLAPALAGPAQAAFNVCNRTKQPARLAIGFFDGQDWTAEGWWTVQPRQCARLIAKTLDARYYYLYASDGAGSWEGGTHFCVAAEGRFRIPGRARCAARGFDRRGFFQVDTGNKAVWTHTLSG